MPIIELPQDLVAKIAAGEVIERPASVSKELVENSLDSGARRVEVELRGGGIPFLRVTDDGQGIPPEEVGLAFLRHATSKLVDLADLAKISTLGFRGEALPSIAAVAEVSMLTRTPDRELGMMVRIKEGRVIESGERGCPPGTTVTVRDLFSGLPARRKFLRPATTEARRVTDVVARYCLAYPEVQFLLHNDGRQSLQTPGDGQTTSAVASLYGAQLAKALVPVDAKDASLAVQGLISPPSEARASRQMINFFINRRWVQSAPLLRALEDAYQDLLPGDRFPVALINLYLPPDEVDVNIHPAKREVRFYREGDLYAFVRRAVREAIGHFAPAKTAFAGIGPFLTHPGGGFPEVSGYMSQTVPGGLKPALVGGSVQTPALELEASDQGPLRIQLPILRVVGQMGDTYIIAEGPDGMYLVDQHTAHERVLYEKLKGGGDEVSKQGLLDPLVLEVRPAQVGLLASWGEVLGRWGFEVGQLDQNACLLRTAPSLLKGTKLKEAFQEILTALEETSGGPAWEERMRQSLACHGAVRAGQSLSIQEMRELLLALEATELPYTCPHGRPTMVYLSSARLAREFGR